MAFIGYGSDLQTDIAGAGYATVGQVVELTPPPIKVKDVDTSNIQMANPWRTFTAGLADGEMCKFKLIYAKANYNTLITKLRTSGNWKVIFPDIVSTASTLVFAGYVNTMPWTYPLDDMIIIDVSVKVSGIVTFTQGTEESHHMATQTVTTLNHGTNLLDVLASAFAVDAGGTDKWLNTGTQFVVVNNGNAGSLTVTLNYGSGGTIDGQVLPNKTFAVVTLKWGIFGPFPTGLFNDANGYCTLAWSVTATVKALIVQLGS